MRFDEKLLNVLELTFECRTRRNKPEDVVFYFLKIASPFVEISEDAVCDHETVKKTAEFLWPCDSLSCVSLCVSVCLSLSSLCLSLSDKAGAAAASHVLLSFTKKKSILPLARPKRLQVGS